MIAVAMEHEFGVPEGGSGQARFALNVDLRLPLHGVTALFGASGAGKTSVLRALAGLLRPRRGRIRFGSQVWQDDGIFLPPHRRPIGYVFQEASLFDHLTVAGNLEFARRRATGAAPPVADVVRSMALGKLLRQYPAALSGGERQRVAMARAILVGPRLLLMDEPLASLDTCRKAEILPLLEELAGASAVPIIYVTHALDEVARLADFLVAIDGGRVRAAGELAATLASPALVTQLGNEACVVIHGTVTGRDDTWGLTEVACAVGSLWLPDGGFAVGSQVRLRVHARDVSIAPAAAAQGGARNRFPAEVTAIMDAPAPALGFLRLRAGGIDILSRVTRRWLGESGIAVGARVWLQVNALAVLG